MPSRSPFAFQRRKQLRPPGWPSPTFAPNQALVNQYPDTTGLAINALIAGEGAPPSDRVVLPDWSPPPLLEGGNG